MKILAEKDKAHRGQIEKLRQQMRDITQEKNKAQEEEDNNTEKDILNYDV